MHSSTTTSIILLTSVLSTASAFVPFQAYPVPAEIDSNVLVPVTDLPPLAATTAAVSVPSSQITPAPTGEEMVNILPVLDINMAPELKKRQGAPVGQPAAAPGTEITQQSPITTYQINIVQNGAEVQTNVVYTQTFAPVPDQWPSPTKQGTIGLGTIQGEIGVVKTKRSLPTQAPMAPPTESPATEKETVDESVPLLDMLRKAGQEVKDQLECLVNKIKKPPVDDDDTRVPLEKEAKLHSTTSETADPFTFGTTTDGESEEDLINLLPKLRAVDNDARILKAGSLAVIAVAIGTMCVNYL